MTFRLLPARIACAMMLLSSAVQNVVAQGRNASMSMMPLAAPLFIEDDGRQSTLTIVNGLPSTTGATVTLFGLDGKSLAMSPIVVSGHGTLTVAVESLLQTAGVATPLLGSILITPSGPADLAAQLSISRIGLHSDDDVEEEFLMTGSSGMGMFRGVSPLSAQAQVIAIQNVGGVSQSASLDCISSSGKTENQVVVAPHATVLVESCVTGSKPLSAFPPADQLPKATQSQFGIAVTSMTSPSTLAVFGLNLSTSGMNIEMSGITFADVSMLNSANEIVPSLPVNQCPAYGGQAFKIAGAIANFGSHPGKASVTLVSNGSQVLIDTVSIAPQSVSPIDFGKLSGVVSPQASLIITTDSGPGQMVAQVEAVLSQSEFDLRISLPWKDLEQTPNGGQHPWNISNGFSSTLVLFNPDASNVNTASVTLYQGPTVWKRRWPVPPQSAVYISIDNIVNQGLLDDHGQMLARNSPEGLAMWYTLQKSKLFGVLVQSDPGSHLARTYACYQTTIPCGVSLSSVSVAVGSQSSSYPTFNTCIGSAGSCSISGCVGGAANCSEGGDDLVDSYDWSIANTSLATLANGNTEDYAQLQGVSVGSTTLHLLAQCSNGCTQNGIGGVTVTASTPKIMFGGNDITNKTTNVIVGQFIDVTASYTPPSGKTVSTQSWSVAGSVVAGYTQSSSTASVTAFSPPSSNEAKFYWIAGGSSSSCTSLAVSYSVTLSDGSGPFKGSTTFCVYAPTATFTSMTGSVQVCTSGCAQSPPALAFGNASTYGISWSGNVTTPSIAGGQVALTQVINVDNVQTLDPSGAIGTLTTNNTFVLDGTPQYANDTQSYYAGQKGLFQSNDTPGSGLTSSMKHQEDSESFQTYLMFQPTGGIWVTLASMSWNWAGGATKSGTVWTLDSGSTHSTNPSGTGSSTLPTWSSNISQYNYH